MLTQSTIFSDLSSNLCGRLKDDCKRFKRIRIRERKEGIKGLAHLE